MLPGISYTNKSVVLFNHLLVTRWLHYELEFILTAAKLFIHWNKMQKNPDLGFLDTASYGQLNYKNQAGKSQKYMNTCQVVTQTL